MMINILVLLISRTIFIGKRVSILPAAIMVLMASCVKYPPLEFNEDIQELKKDSIARIYAGMINADSIEFSVRGLQNSGTRFALAENRRVVATRILNKFRKMGYTDCHLDSFLIDKTWGSQDYSLWQYNVIAVLPGSRYPDSVSVIGAHYDSIVQTGDPFSSAPGANDNASGVAAMTEIARVFMKGNYQPLSSIYFVAFGAEEIGLMGSRDYASKLYLSDRQVRMMINNDMIANVRTSNPLTWKVNIVGYINSFELLELSKRTCSRYTNLLYTSDGSDYNRSDSYAFYEKNFRTVFFISESPYEYYHTENDIYQNCNFDFCAEVTKLSCALLIWSDTPEL